MIIHSHFKDYYDTASAYGVDATIHFDRDATWRVLNRQWIGLPDTLTEWLGEARSIPIPDGETHSGKIYNAIVGFCGHLYPVKYTCSSSEQTDFRGEQFFYDYSKYVEWLKSFTVKPYQYRRRYAQTPKSESIFAEAPYNNDDIFIALCSPIFIAIGSRSEVKVELQMPLKHWEFYKVKDPVTAFQEIQMYLTNQLVKEKDVGVIEDKYRIAGHGYDKYSFRHPIKL